MVYRIAFAFLYLSYDFLASMRLKARVQFYSIGPD
jgi:hypothetical protein